MRIAARPLLLLHSDRLFCEQVRKASMGEFDLQVVSDWRGLRSGLRAAPPSTVVVVDPYDRRNTGESLSPQLHSLLLEFPSTTVIAACEVRLGRADDLRLLGQWGVARVLTLDEENSPIAIARRLSSGQGRPLQNLLRRVLPPTTPGRAQAILLAAVQTVSVGGTAEDLSRSLNVTSRTLLRWCRRSRLPAPRQLLVWMRILLAAELLDDTGRSVLGVAYACGYSSDAALRNALRAYLNASPRELRARGAFREASTSFLAALASARAGQLRGRRK